MSYVIPPPRTQPPDHRRHLDGTSDGCHPDIITTYSNGAICAFEYDPDQHTLTPKPGWPYLLSDIGREPTLTQLGSSDDGYSLVVQENSGWLHVLDLPFAGQPACALGWPSYGADDGNTRGRLSYGSQPRGDGSAAAVGLGLEILGHHPVREDVRFRIIARGVGTARLDVYDVAGRLTRRLLNGPVPGGAGEVLWDRRSDTGFRVPAGLYWCRLRAGGDEQRLRVVVLP